MAEGLTNKQRLFVEAYLTCFNATEAAKRAGYSEKTAYSIGWENLKKPEIDAAIRQGLAERAMPADEVLARLAEHARGDIGAFIATGEDGMPSGFSLASDRPLHRVKKVTVTDKGWSFEMYDAQAALVHLGKHHGLFIERHEHSWQEQLKQQGHDPDAVKQQLVAAAVAALTSADRSDDEGCSSGSTPADT